jgi:hypothetical protein
MTVFTFIEKSQKLMTDAGANQFYSGLASLVCMAVFLVLFVSIMRGKNPQGRYVYFLFVFLGVFGFQFVQAHQNYSDVHKEYSELASLYHSLDFKIVEGDVHVLHLEPENGHAAGDIIEIDGVEFEFSCFHDTLGYNKTIVYGGVLTEGTFARVYYYQPTNALSSRDTIILQIDLLEPVANPIKRIDPLLPCARS